MTKYNNKYSHIKLPLTVKEKNIAHIQNNRTLFVFLKAGYKELFLNAPRVKNKITLPLSPAMNTLIFQTEIVKKSS